MDLVSIQRCESSLPWWSINVPSKSDPDRIYEVLIPLPTDGVEEFICSCEGFKFRGHCSHQTTANEYLCRWDSLEGPEEQSKEETKDFICPRCGNKTTRTTEYA